MTVQEMENRIRDLEYQMASLSGNIVDLNGRRFTNAGASVSSTDFVTKIELESIRALIPSPPDPPAEDILTTGKRFPKVRITGKDGILFYGSAGTLVGQLSPGVFDLVNALTLDNLEIATAILMSDAATIGATGGAGVNATITWDVSGTSGLAFNIDTNDVLRLDPSNVIINGISQWDACTATAANDMGPTGEGNLVVVSGNTQINGFLSTGYQNGTVRIFNFSGTPTVKHNTAPSAGYSRFLLHGSADLVCASGTTFAAVLTSGGWLQIAPARTA